MTDDTPPSNDCTIVHCFYFLATVILIPTGLLHGPYVLFQIGMGLFLLPFAVGIFALAVGIVFLAVKRPFVGALMVFVGTNITMIATHHCPESLFFLLFSCVWAAEIPILLFSIWYLCRTSYYQRKAVVLEAVVVNRFTEENNNINSNNNNSTSSLDYYWVGEYEAPSSLQYVKSHNRNQQGAEKNGLEECCNKEEEEEVCYKMQQQRFQKKFLVTVDLYQAASLEVLVLPGRPEKAMLIKPLEEKRRRSKFVSLFFFIHAGGFSFPGFVLPLKKLIDSSRTSDNKYYGQIVYNDYNNGTCSHIEWQTYVPYITLVVMVMLAVSNTIWKEYHKGEFAAVTVPPTGGEQELTVVGPQKKKKEDNEYHHHVNVNDDETVLCSRELDNDDDDETACTRELDNDDETACTREPVGTGRNGAFLV